MEDTIGLNAGIDAAGGRNYIVKFDQPVSAGEVAQLLHDPLEGSVSVITISSTDRYVFLPIIRLRSIHQR